MKPSWVSLSLHSLRAQVLLWTILPLTIFLIIFSLTGVSVHQNSMRGLVAEENTKLVAAMSSAIASQIDRYRVGLEAIAALEAQHPVDDQTSRLHLADISQIWGGFSLLLVKPDGQQIVAPDSVPSWATEVLQTLPSSSEQTGTPFMSTTADRSVVFWGIWLPHEGRWLIGGVPVSALALDSLMDVEHPGAETTVALLDQEGYVLAGRGDLPATGQANRWPGVAEAFAGTSGVLFIPDSGDEDIVAYAPVSGAHWALVIREPWHALTAPLIRFEQAMPFILIIAAAISFLTLFFGLRYVVRPLRSLGVQAGRIGQGNFEAAQQPVGGVVEIEDLRLAIDQMARQLQRDQTALKDYLRAITQAQEEERARLGRELHDETVQTLIALDHKAQMVQRALERNPAQTPERVSELRQMTGEAIEEVRRFSRALRPLYLDDLGLVPALEMLAREAGAVFSVVGTPHRLKPEKEMALYRIAQEALSNVRRHAKARKVTLEFCFLEAGARLQVNDDGVGFEAPQNFGDLTRTGHFGLMGMHERASLADAQFALVSSPGKGTSLSVTVPQ